MRQPVTHTNRMNCLGWGSLAVKLSCPRHTAFHDRLVLQACRILHSLLRELNRGAESVGRPWDNDWPQNLFWDSSDWFHYQRNVQEKGTLLPEAGWILRLERALPCLSQAMTLPNRTQLYLAGFSQEFPPFFLCPLRPCPVGGGSEDIENHVPCRLMKTGCSDPRGREFWVQVCLAMRCPIWCTTCSYFGPAGVLIQGSSPSCLI